METFLMGLTFTLFWLQAAVLFGFTLWGAFECGRWMRRRF